jgi:hypothetical protein
VAERVKILEAKIAEEVSRIDKLRAAPKKYDSNIRWLPLE